MGTIWELFAKLIALINQTDCWCGVETGTRRKNNTFTGTLNTFPDRRIANRKQKAVVSDEYFPCNICCHQMRTVVAWNGENIWEKSRQYGQGRDTGFPFYLLRNEFTKIVDKDWYTYSFSIILSIIFYFKGAILLLCNIENIFFCRNILKRFHFPLGVDIMILYFAFNLSSKPR